MTLPGNCILGALVLWLRHGGMIELHPSRPTWITHCVVRCQDGRRRHFRLERDILPLPIGYFLFLGRFEELP